MKKLHSSLSCILLGAFSLASFLLISGTVQGIGSAGQNATRSSSDVPKLAEIDLPSSELRSALERYVLDRGSLGRSYPVAQSPARRQRFKQFCTQWLEALAKQNFEAMSQAGQVEYLLFKNHLDYELRQLDLQAKLSAETATLVPFEQTVADLEEARRRMEWIDPQKASTMLNGLNKQIEATRKTVEATSRPDRSTGSSPEESKVKKAVANRAATTVDGLRNTLRNWFSFYNGYDPLFTWWVDAPYRTVDTTLQNYAAFLRERIVGLRPPPAQTGTAPQATERPTAGGQFGGALGGQFGGAQFARGGRPGGTQAQPGSSEDIIGDPIGREALLSDLAHEMIPYTPEELIAIANKEFEWCENELKKASRELGYGDDWHKALEYVKSLYVEPGKQPELIRELAVEAIKFLDDHDLITMPQLARESWRMEMMSPERQLVNPFFTGGETISVSYPTNTMTYEQKMMSMRGNNIHFARATVFHEIIPGHHLAGFMTARYRPYRSLFSTSFWGEGWPLYWEILLYDMNFPKTPENRIGVLFWRAHRCARIIFSLSFHLGKMTPQECIDLLVKRVGHEQENAIAEVRRSFGGSYAPLYQAAYMVGGLQFWALRKELVDSAKMTNRAFHDAILRENSMPVEMVRALLTKQKLTRDFAPSWKFHGSDPGAR